MNYWLLKTEPETYSWSQLQKDGRTEWTGVRSYEARNNMKKMSAGDLVFVYHSGKEKQIVGVGKVIAFAHPDSTDDTGVWECVDIAPVEELKKTVSLTEVKYISVCHAMVLLKKSRLSVQPVTKKEWEAIVNF